MFKNRLIVFFLLILSCSSSSEVSVTQTKIHDYKYNDDEARLMDMINNHRDSIGLQTLGIIDHISYLCSLHDIYMIERFKPSHDGFVQRSDELIQLFGASFVSENVAYNYKSNKAVLKAWLASSDHKKNIEGNYTNFGLSIRIDSVNKRKYYTNIFIKVSK